MHYEFEGLLFGGAYTLRGLISELKKKPVKVTQHLANRFTADRYSEENKGLALRSSAVGSLYRGKFISFWLMTIIL